MTTKMTFAAEPVSVEITGQVSMPQCIEIREAIRRILSITTPDAATNPGSSPNNPPDMLSHHVTIETFRMMAACEVKTKDGRRLIDCFELRLNRPFMGTRADYRDLLPDEQIALTDKMLDMIRGDPHRFANGGVYLPNNYRQAVLNLIIGYLGYLNLTLEKPDLSDEASKVDTQAVVAMLRR